MKSRVALPLALVGALITSCGSDSSSSGSGSGKLSVVAAFYPIEEAAKGVGGDLIEVIGITPPGQGPHDLELQAKQVASIESADIALYIGRGFQPQVEKAVSGAKNIIDVDLLDSVELLKVDAQLEGTQGKVDGEVLDGGVDPHVWLDPARMITMVGKITETFSSADKANAAAYRANADKYLANLTGLDGDYKKGLATCDSRVIVTSHRAFGYLADTYDLRQIPIAGVSPEVEPDPKTLTAIANEAKAAGVTTIFLESIAPPDLAETVAKEIGANLDLLDPIEGLTREQIDGGTTYAAIMRENLDRLRKGLGCT